MQETFSDDRIKKKLASGILILGVRKILFQGILTTSNIILARILAPKIFGVFAIISFLVLIVGIITTVGLGPALVQKKGKVKNNQLRVIFTTQVIAAFLFAVFIYLLAPAINGLYRGELGAEGIFWLRLFSISLVFVNAAGVSNILLERNLEYIKITIGNVLSLFLTQAFIIFFALKGTGIGSFVLGNIIGNFLSFFIYFFLSPWNIGINFRFKNLKPLLSFGIDYQLNSAVGIVNSAVIPGFVGAVSGSRAVGLVNWAGGVRQAGLAPFEVVKSLIFPTASRAQGKKRLLKSIVEKMIELSTLLSFPTLAILFALAPEVTYIIYTSNWLAGLTALYLSLIQGIFILGGTILQDVLLALGRAKTARNISLFWAILQWALTVPLVLLWDFNGVVLAGLLVSSTFFIPLKYVKREVDIDIWTKSVPYLIYSVASGFLTYLITRFILIDSLFKLIVIGATGASFYILLLFLLKKDAIKNDILVFRRLVFNKKT